MKKILIFLILTLTLLSLSAVSAAENATDAVELDDNADIILDDASPVNASDAVANSTEDNVVQESEISAKPTTGYEKFTTQFSVTLTSNGTALASKPVTISLNKQTYDRVTDDNGTVTLNVKLTKGTYTATFSFLGDENYTASNGTAKITVKSPYNTKLSVADKNINYRQGSKSVFIVRLLTTSGSAVKNQQVTFKVNGKTYTGKTDSKGYAQIFLSLKKGTHKVTYSFKANNPYLSSSGSYSVKVKAPIAKGNGYWMWGESMKKVNLKNLKNKGTKHIFLHSYSITLFGKSAVTSWIAKAAKYGIKVHIWMQIFYDGKWISPINKDGTFKYTYMNKKIKLAKTYAKMKGVAGIHLDYTRFGGTAPNYGDAVKVINYFVKKACVEVRKVKSNCIMSSSVMPEPGMTDYYYGQDIPTMTKYLDVIVPMAYKGNYHKTTTWLNYVTKAFVMDSNGAQVWTGLQAYKSDSNAKRLSTSELLKDAKAAKSGGAKGVMLFRIGLTYALNFNKV